MPTRILLRFTVNLAALWVLSAFLSSMALPQKADTTTQEARSTKTFRILNDISIKYENTKTTVFRYMELGRNGEVRGRCEQFLKDLRAARDSSRTQAGLTVDDRRFIDRSLERMRKRIQTIIDDLPPGS